MGIIEALIGAAVATAAAGTGYSVYAGEQGKKAQNQAMQRQERAQAETAQRAAMQQQRSQRAMTKASQAQPDVASIMASAQEAASGPSATMLTGPQGIDPSQLSLGRSTLLGS